MREPAGSNRFIAYISANKWMAAAIIIVLLLRFSFIGIMGAMPQDAYYFFYGQHFALSYFDHPPAIAWLLRGFTDVLGRHVYVIKLADTLVTIGTLLAFYSLARYFLPPQRSWNALLLIGATLMVTILSLVSTPDVPLLFFWTLSLITVYKVVFEGRKAYWIWAGIAMGLTFDSKYTAIFLPAGERRTSFSILRRSMAGCRCVLCPDSRIKYSRYIFISSALWLCMSTRSDIFSSWKLERSFNRASKGSAISSRT